MVGTSHLLNVRTTRKNTILHKKIMLKFWIKVLPFILCASCQVKEDSISKELLFLKNDTLSSWQIDSILIANEIPKIEWETHKTDSIDGVYIPYNLYDCFSQIDSLFSDSFKSAMVKNTAEEMIAEYHFSYGLWMRNNWGLWKHSRLWMYFYNKGVSHPDVISSLILETYHRKINNTKLLFQEELEAIRASVAEDEKLEQKEREREAIISSRFEVGDSIDFEMPINTTLNRTFLYGHPLLHLEFKDEFRDLFRDSMLRINGLVIDKNYIENDSVADFHIKILNLNPANIKAFGGKDIGDEIELQARHLYLLD